MKNHFLLLLFVFTISSNSQTINQKMVSTDIDNFWKAYDKIVAEKDSIKQYSFLKELYLDQATPGLKSLLEVRNYTAKDYINAINKYPKFWNSLKPNTLNSAELYPEIDADISKLKQAYPDLKPSTIYFSIGAFRTNGTIQEDRVLIGSELSLADETTIIDELPAWRQPFYKEYEPRKNIALLCTHEYVHTQQKELVEDLLLMCLYEGVAEFISCKVTHKKSSSPAIEFGKSNQPRVIDQFIADLYIKSNNYNWIWGENRNLLKVRDLGYYIGYEICERYYNSSKDKTKAIKTLIELDYHNEKEVARIVDGTKLFPQNLKKLRQNYEKQRPSVVSISAFKNGSQKVKSGETEITITFSEPLNGRSTGIDFGPLGESFFPKIDTNRIWSADMKSWTIKADLKPGQHYQILISDNFRKQNGVRLKPFLIDFKTAE
ncbi:Ig-like domain-containing protein [Flavobacterium lipolyticum]|uniref:Ig-like domain-containing protein n=1 Tax=Flavobacterium lipolyticum TaxID=2893754 RepID=A0ABS8LZJ9_9FLAO|nr:Ig-like domain-containing protein [Flavobacterium sp. F-126]MCC9017391.1 Ig-like domain-containing protein [Flavobacterium sp. F-126]